MSTLSLADEADFIALRSQLPLPTKPTSSGDEVNSIFEGSLYVFQTLVAHGVMVAYYVVALVEFGDRHQVTCFRRINPWFRE